MIKEIDIVNFQSHNSTHLELAPGVNVIVGASDSGKSAIIRALRWLIWNRPVGDAFRSHWGGLTTVNLTMDNGWTVERSKGNTSNVYALAEYDKGKFEEFKAFGNDVPQPIQEILNLDETNLQRQGDSPFLISSTPGEVSGYFNRIAKLDKIDSSLKYITSKVKGLTNQIKSDESRLQDLELEAGKFGHLDGAEAQLEVLEADLKAQNQRRSGLQTLRELHAGILYQDNLLDLEQEIIDKEEAVDALLDMYAVRTQVDADRDLLQNTLIDLRICETEILTTEEKIEDLPLIETVLYNQQRHDEIQSQLDDFKDLVKEISMLAINTVTAQTKHDNSVIEFEQSMPDTCPLCGK